MKSLYEVMPCSCSVASSSSAPSPVRSVIANVVAHVDQLIAVRLSVPVGERVRERLALALDPEVDVGRRAAERRRGLARLDVVDRDRPAERHVEVRVRVDAARQQVLAARVDHAVRVDVERLADQRHALVLDVHVGDVVVGRGHDAAALDQHGHGPLPSWTPASPGRRRGVQMPRRHV
jgi:hypothetical protein